MWRRNDKREAGRAPDADHLEQLRRENERLFDELDGTQRRFRGLAKGVWRVQEDERRRLARELHDQLGQVLTALIHRLEGVPGEDREDCMSLARQALEDVRELSRLLRPAVLDDLGLVAALKWLARRTRESTGLEVSVHAPESSERLDPDVETLLFRVAQEAVTNAVKHAAAGEVDIRLSRTGNQIELRIRDDGRGFDPERAITGEERGIGLAGMHDRLDLFGGRLVVSSSPGRGTTISATLAL